MRGCREAVVPVGSVNQARYARQAEITQGAVAKLCGFRPGEDQGVGIDGANRFSETGDKGSEVIAGKIDGTVAFERFGKRKKRVSVYGS